MKKVFLLIICSFLLSYPAVAQADSDAQAIKVLQVEDKQMSPTNQNSDSEGSDDFYNELISPDYGCDQSPAFLNRDEMNHNEDSYGYGSPEASGNDGSGGGSYNCETNE